MGMLKPWLNQTGLQSVVQVQHYIKQVNLSYLFCSVWLEQIFKIYNNFRIKVSSTKFREVFLNEMIIKTLRISLEEYELVKSTTLYICSITKSTETIHS